MVRHSEVVIDGLKAVLISYALRISTKAPSWALLSLPSLTTVSQVDDEQLVCLAMPGAKKRAEAGNLLLRGTSGKRRIQCA